MSRASGAAAWMDRWPSTGPGYAEEETVRAASCPAFSAAAALLKRRRAAKISSGRRTAAIRLTFAPEWVTLWRRVLGIASAYAAHSVSCPWSDSECGRGGWSDPGCPAGVGSHDHRPHRGT